MARRIDVQPRLGLEDYESVAHLSVAVRDLRMEARRVAPKLRGRTLWMVNSTEQGGGVAEMLPSIISLLRELGISAEWAVIEAEDPRFFVLTKRIHNLIHGSGEASFEPDDRERFEAVTRQNAGFFLSEMGENDILVVHDPQPMPLAAVLREKRDVRTIWRCHIGLDETTPETRAAWEFLEPYAGAYDHAVFSAPEYIPDCFRHHASLIYPAIDPLEHKNRELSLHKTVGILANAALAMPPSPVLTAPYPAVAERLQADGTFVPATAGEEIGLLSRPIVTQISRWDRLKGWRPLMEAFARLKERARESPSPDLIHRTRLELVRLVLAGPDPASVADDPEGQEVLADLTAFYSGLRPDVQRDIALLALPMEDRAQNALMVNAIQRASSIIVQNSLREGFGLTITEGMWKRVPVLSNTQACGPRQQVRDQRDGRMVHDPEDAGALSRVLGEMLECADCRDEWGRSAQRRVHEHFLVFSQLRSWINLLEDMAETEWKGWKGRMTSPAD